MSQGKKKSPTCLFGHGMTGGFVGQIPASRVGRVFCLMPFDPMLIMPLHIKAGSDHVLVQFNMPTISIRAQNLEGIQKVIGKNFNKYEP